LLSIRGCVAVVTTTVVSTAAGHIENFEPAIYAGVAQIGVEWTVRDHRTHEYAPRDACVEIITIIDAIILMTMLIGFRLPARIRHSGHSLFLSVSRAPKFRSGKRKSCRAQRNRSVKCGENLTARKKPG